MGVGHCDTLDGPLVTLAQRALEENNVNLVLPWMSANDEEEIRHAFELASTVRKLGPEARSLADRHFFETLVRVHRASEGAPFTGLKPAGLDLGPALPAADRALAEGSAEKVVKLLVEAVRDGVHKRFHTAASRREFDANDLAAGRRYVESYVAYLHYVEGLWQAATAPLHHLQAADAKHGTPAVHTHRHGH